MQTIRAHIEVGDPDAWSYTFYQSPDIYEAAIM